MRLEHSRRQDDNEKRLQASVESLRQQLIQQHTEFDKVKVQLEAVKRHDEETINRMRAQNERSQHRDESSECPQPIRAASGKDAIAKNM